MPICQAFPNGIPVIFTSGEFLHDKVLKGQEGDTVWKEVDHSDLSIHGGPGSGNFGHGGRKGVVGGSSKEGGDKSTGNGDCYEAAGKYMMDHGIGQKGLVLVHGEVTGQGPIEGLKFGHSWLEKDGMVIDKANGRDLHLPMELYYHIGKIGDNVHKYDYKQFIEKVMKAKTWGPWDLKTESGL
jgi:hypothetical protein